MLILVPWFGDVARFEPLAHTWLAHYRDSGTSIPFRWLTERPGPMPAPGQAWPVDLAGFTDLVRPGQPFDVKGAMVCTALLGTEEPLLVLDLDAVLLRCPAPQLRDYTLRAIAMPVDHGAITHGRAGRLEAPYADVPKLCAGVMFFGACSQRGRLVAAYRKAWLELLPVLPWRPALPHLLEQYAWSVALKRRGGAVLPHVFNWSPDHLGDNPFATIQHRYGLRKWV